MGVEALMDAAELATIVAIAAIYLGLLISTIVLAMKGDVPHALMCGMALLTMISGGLGLIVLILVIIATAFTRNVEIMGCVAAGFVIAIVVYVALCVALGVGIAIAG